MRVIDSVIDFPKGDWGEDRLFIRNDAVGVIDGSSPIMVTSIEGYHSQAEWLADNLSIGLQEDKELPLPFVCRVVTDTLSKSEELQNLNLSKENLPCATFAGISYFNGRVSVFVLGDCSVVFEMKDGTFEVLTDKRIKKFSEKTKEARRLALESGEDVSKAVKTQMTANREAMNTEDGFWTVGLHGKYWYEFLCEKYLTSELKRCLIMSDGFERVFTEGLLSYHDVLSERVSLASAVGSLRTWEGSSRSSEIKRSDDASAILVEF